MNANNVAVLPVGSAIRREANEKLNPSIVVLTPTKDDAVIIRKILDGCCELTVCSSSPDFNDLIKRSRDLAPELVLVRDLLIEKDPDFLNCIREDLGGHTPLLIFGSKSRKDYPSMYMHFGARDTVSLDEVERTRFVVIRELQDYRVRCAYKRHAARAAKYKRQLRRFTKPAADVVTSASDAAIPIYDRTGFLEELLDRLTRSSSRGVRVLAWIRPDQFRTVEETVGILAGEDALSFVHSLLLNLKHPADLCGRIGGTVFAVLIERGTIRDVEAWVQQFYRALNERPFSNESKSVPLSCTTGLCEISGESTLVEQIFRDASDACRRGRLQGDGQILLSASSKSARSSRLRDKKWAKRIKLALKNNRFELVHSPVVRLDGRNEKVRDTWMRMIDEKGNAILPGEFFPVAKRLGLMTLIDRWVIAATLTYCTKRKPSLVFVRLSKSTILDSSLCQWLERVFEGSKVKPSQICFQITEAVAGQNMPQVVRHANDLRDSGFKIAVECIGADKDMKDVLHSVPMHYARIDPAILQGVARDKLARQQVAKIVSAARERGILAIADRVEDAATMATLCQMDVEFVQGDYLRRDNIVIEDTMTICTPVLPPAMPG